MEHY
jgi:flagellum-specific peptidoglycan hydrolase FlgJ